MVSEVDHAVVDVGQALVPLAGESAESILALDAESHAVILDTIGDCTGDTAAPVGSLGESVRALSANVGGGNVEVAVVDFLQTPVLNENVAVSATLADGGASVLAVGETSGDVSNKRAGKTVFQVVSLLTLDAAAEIVDGFADVVARLDASTGRIVVKILGVALSAVQVVHILETTSGIGRGSRGN